jgi:hypothetical protein
LFCFHARNSIISLTSLNTSSFRDFNKFSRTSQYLIDLSLTSIFFEFTIVNIVCNWFMILFWKWFNVLFWILFSSFCIQMKSRRQESCLFCHCDLYRVFFLLISSYSWDHVHCEFSKSMNHIYSRINCSFTLNFFFDDVYFHWCLNDRSQFDVFFWQTRLKLKSDLISSASRRNRWLNINTSNSWSNFIFVHAIYFVRQKEQVSKNHESDEY